MASPFENSIFYNITVKSRQENFVPTVILGGVAGSQFSPLDLLENIDIVIFDFETTGIQFRKNRIIEIGAVKYRHRKEVDIFETLINPRELISAEITEITKLTNEDLEGQPYIEEKLFKFHDFLRGSLLVAHNAEFDISFLVQESARLGMQCDYHAACSLKMARDLLKHLERKNLDFLAAHYGLNFEARHRSIGDVRVTAGVLWRMFDEYGIKTVAQLDPYKELMTKLF